MNGKNLIQQLTEIKQKMEQFRNDLAFSQGRLGQILDTIEKDFGFKPEGDMAQNVLKQMEKEVQQTETKLNSMIKRFETRFRTLEKKLNE